MMAGLSVQPSSLWTMNGSSSGFLVPSEKMQIAPLLSRAMPLARNSSTSAGEAVVVVTLAEPVIEVHVERVVDFLQAAFRDLDALLPDGEVFRIAGLEFDQLVLAGFEHGGIGLGGGVHLAVDADQLGDRIGFERGGIEQGFPAVEDHAELGAPVADVVVADDLVAEEPRDAAERVADDRRADVADVHRLGHVRRGEIDDHGFARADGGDAELFVAQQGGGAGGVGGGQDAEIDEARAGDVGGGEAVELRGGR